MSDFSVVWLAAPGGALAKVLEPGADQVAATNPLHTRTSPIPRMYHSRIFVKIHSRIAHLRSFAHQRLAKNHRLSPGGKFTSLQSPESRLPIQSFVL
ncbi:MAG TPA: hypothetical protein VH558_01725 [Pseudolabrys sp.]|jgi:hypothetical protein